MTARSKRPNAARIDRAPPIQPPGVADMLEGLRLWRVVPPDPADLVNSPSACRMAAKQKKSAGATDEPSALSVAALGIDPLSCPRIGRDDDLSSRKPHAGMPRAVPELPPPLDPGAIDRQLLRVVAAWAGLPQRTRKTIVAVASAGCQSQPDETGRETVA